MTMIQSQHHEQYLPLPAITRQMPLPGVCQSLAPIYDLSGPYGALY
jgi:hypothetical protein